jgi:hypothetical protein
MYNPTNVMMILRSASQLGEWVPAGLNERRLLSEPDDTDDDDENPFDESGDAIRHWTRNTQQRKGNYILTEMHRPIKRQQKHQRRR